MTPAESQQALGTMLAKVLDRAGDKVVSRAIVVFEVVEDLDEGTAAIWTEATDRLTYTDHIGLLRNAQVQAEAVILRAHLADEDDE